MVEKKKEKLKKTDEERETEETEEEEGKEQPGDLINKANEAAERIEKGTEDLKKQLDRQERIKVEETLGGETEAGKPAQTEEEKEIEGAKELLKGTGFEDVLDPPEVKEKKKE